MVRLRNVPIPQASLTGIAIGLGLAQVRAWRVTRRRFVGWAAAAAGGLVVAESVKAAGSTELAKPEGLVISGPYAVSRNPMYVGWALIQLGIGVAAGSGWVLATLPFVGAAVHREVLSEERRLSEKFGDEYEAYCATVGRYLPHR